jgi:hypothetical protein
MIKTEAEAEAMKAKLDPQTRAKMERVEKDIEDKAGERFVVGAMLALRTVINALPEARRAIAIDLVSNAIRLHYYGVRLNLIEQVFNMTRKHEPLNQHSIFIACIGKELMNDYDARMLVMKQALNIAETFAEETNHAQQ